MKKFTSIILTFVLALSNMAFCVFAAGEPVEIVLLAPPAGVAAVQENVLPDGEYIADGAPEGVYVNGGNIALDGSSVGGGNFTVIDSNGDVAAAVNVVPYLYYEDFEDRTVGDSISTALLPKLSPDADDKSMFADDSTVLIAEENGNKYAEGNGIAGSVNPIVIPFADTGVNSDIVNFRAKILRKTGDGGASYPGLIVYDSVNTSSSPLIELRFIAPSGKNTRTNIWSKGLADGTRGSGNGTTIGSFGNEAWIELRVEMNFSTKKYDIYMGEDCIANDFIMYNSQTTSGKIGSIQLGVRTDDILIYSGAEADVTIEGNMPEYVTVSQDKTSMIPFDVAVEPFGTLPEFTSNTNGVSVVDGFICVAPNTSASTAELTAEAFGETKDFTVNLNAALEGDMDSGSVNISERAVFNAKVKNGGTLSLLTDNGSVDIDVSAGLEEYSNLDVYLDLNNGSYISVLDKKIIEEDSFDAESLTGFAMTGELQLDDIYFGSAYEALPELFDVIIEGAVMCEETASADYRYFSVIDEELSSVSYEWYIADDEELTGTCVSTESTFTPSRAYIGKYLYLAVIAETVNGNSCTAYSERTEVQDIFTAVKVNGGIKFDIKNVNEEDKILPFAVLYDNGKIIDIYAMNINAVAGDNTCVLPVGDNYEGARVFILDEELTPLSSTKNIGSVPNIYTTVTGEECFNEKNGVISFNSEPVQFASLFIMKPKTAGSFEYAYSPRNMIVNISETGNSVKDYVAFADVTETDVSFNHFLTAEGYYAAYAKLKDGTEKEMGFGIALDKLFVSEELKTSNEDTFVNIFSNLTELSAEKLREIYKVYKVLNDKEAVGGFLGAESYNMDLFETVIYLSAFVENPEYKEKLIPLLNSKNYDSTPVTLMSQNSDFEATADALIDPCDIETYLKDMKEKAILLGIKNAVNYLEAKIYLEAACGHSVSDSVARTLRGATFTSIADVVTAVSSQSGGSGSSGGSGGSGDSGSSGDSEEAGSSAGTGGPGGGNVTVASKPKDPESQSSKKSFTDVSESHWANESIVYLASRGILDGYADGKFLPEKKVTRAEFVKMICETFGISGNGSSFRDISDTDWYYSYVNAASGAGIITGSDGLFRPTDTITRQDATLILYRAATACNMEFNADSVELSDYGRISEYAQEAVSALCAAGIINGYPDGSFMPTDSLTRAQAAAILTRLITY